MDRAVCNSPDGSPRRVSLWLVGATVTLLLVAAIGAGYQLYYWCNANANMAGPGYIWADGRTAAGDFVQFAGVAEAWRTNEIGDIYSIANQRRFMGRAAEMEREYPFILSFNYPPFFCWLLRPLVGLDYLQLFTVWTLIQTTFAFWAILLWRSELGRSPAWFIAVAAFILSPSACNNWILGHVSFFGLFAMSLCLRQLNAGKEFTAGMALSLLFYKPTMGVVLGPLLVAKLRWRAVLGVAVGGALLFAASWAASPKAVVEFPNMGRELFKLATVDFKDFFTRHFTWLALVCDATFRPPTELTPVEWFFFGYPLVGLTVLLGWAWRGPWRPGTDQFAAGCSAAVLATLIFTPYAYSYDMMLALIALVYSLRTFPRRPGWHKWAVLVCGGLAGYYVAGDLNLLKWLDPYLPTRAQLAPAALAAWLILETLTARLLNEKPTPPAPATDEGKGGDGPIPAPPVDA